jgi:hypothetical protein
MTYDSEVALSGLALELIFSDPALSRTVFQMMDELDRGALDKVEPAGLIIRYGIDLTRDGVSVMRMGDLPRPGERDWAAEGLVEVYCRFREGFPTNQWLGPMLVERPAAIVSDLLSECHPAQKADDPVSDGPDIDSPKNSIRRNRSRRRRNIAAMCNAYGIPSRHKPAANFLGHGLGLSAIAPHVRMALANGYPSLNVSSLTRPRPSWDSNGLNGQVYSRSAVFGTASQPHYITRSASGTSPPSPAETTDTPAESCPLLLTQ